MSNETIIALVACIDKYKEYAEVKSPRDILRSALSPDACKLCKLFWNHNCVGCPVLDHTDSRRCRHTPFVLVQQAQDAIEEDRNDDDATYEDVKRWQEACLAEADFLSSLLPNNKS